MLRGAALTADPSVVAGISTTAAAVPERRVADSFERIAAYFLDGFIVNALAFIPLSLLLSDIAPETTTRAEMTVWVAVATFLPFLWFGLFEGSRLSATPGKRLLGLRVVDAESGESPIGFKRAAVRRVIWVLGFVALFLGWIAAFRNPDRQGWHDKAARTVVVKVR